MPAKEIIKDISRTHYEELQATKANIKTINENTITLRDAIDLNTMLIIGIVLIILVQGIAFYLIMIRKTHRIAGPAHIMTQYCNEIAEGKNPELRDLRAGDELQELYKAFKTMAASLKKKQHPLKKER
jgi:nitrogen fixation/metabolism regulation signal transduction histidine kinase